VAAAAGVTAEQTISTIAACMGVVVAGADLVGVDTGPTDALAR
jgi:hypothetical protein